jgi:hypothetical protein
MQREVWAKCLIGFVCLWKMLGNLLGYAGPHCFLSIAPMPYDVKRPLMCHGKEIAAHDANT